MLPIHHPAKNDLHIDAEEKMREREGERARGAGWVGGDWGEATRRGVRGENLPKIHYKL